MAIPATASTAGQRPPSFQLLALHSLDPPPALARSKSGMYSGTCMTARAARFPSCVCLPVRILDIPPQRSLTTEFSPTACLLHLRQFSSHPTLSHFYVHMILISAPCRDRGAFGNQYVDSVPPRAAALPSSRPRRSLPPIPPHSLSCARDLHDRPHCHRRTLFLGVTCIKVTQSFFFRIIIHIHSFARTWVHSQNNWP